MKQNIYDALRASHEKQRTLCRQLLRCAPESRLAIFSALKHELAAHAAAEERYLYLPVLLHDAGLHVSRHALAEHHEVDEIVESMRSHNYATDAWLLKARALSAKVHHHLREEERGFFQVTGRILSTAQKTKLARAYAADYERLLDTAGSR